MQKKILFELEQDEDGYPPDRWERLWAVHVTEQHCQVENIPFYVKGIASGDIILAEQVGAEVFFRALITPSGNSVLRLFVFDEADVQSARDQFRALSCESELSHISKLFALEIPKGIPFEPVANLIDEGEKQGRWEYEVGVLRHPVK